MSRAINNSCVSRRAALGGALALCAAPRLLAHRARITVTTITWNPRTPAWEITHRIHVHDALLALGRIDPDAAPDLVALRSRARLALLVEQAFGLATPAGTPLELALIGAEVDGEQLYVYQERTQEQPMKRFLVRCSLLRGLFPDQANHVNVQLGETVKTLFFTGDDTVKLADLS
ncbi:MAG: DUF6702 family protein [Rhodothalassiaceae bacterium]